MSENKWNVKVDVVFVVLGARHGSGRERGLERQVAILFSSFVRRVFVSHLSWPHRKDLVPLACFRSKSREIENHLQLFCFKQRAKVLHQRKWQRQKNFKMEAVIFCSTFSSFTHAQLHLPSHCSHRLLLSLKYHSFVAFSHLLAQCATPRAKLGVLWRWKRE